MAFKSTVPVAGFGLGQKRIILHFLLARPRENKFPPVKGGGRKKAGFLFALLICIVLSFSSSSLTHECVF